MVAWGRSLVIACLAAQALSGIGNVQGQSLPNRPIVITSPYTVGGSVDFAIRTIASKVEVSTAAKVIIESKPGGVGVIAANSVKVASPDGTDLFLADSGTFGSNVSLLARIPYEPLKDFKPITLLWSIPNVLAVPAELPVQSIHDLVDLARKRPNGVTYASQGVGASGHLLGSMLAKASGAPMTHVPYRGAAPAATDLIAGRVDFFFTSYATVKGQVEAGKLKLLAVTSKARDPLLPDLPTVAEAGFPNLEMEIWWGLAAPAQTPDRIIRALQETFAKAAKSPDVIEKLREQDIQAVGDTTEEFRALIASEIERYRPIIRESGARIE
jgi:tripartite-type tricarboxylate transporter receptor subunit TctC